MSDLCSECHDGLSDSLSGAARRPSCRARRSNCATFLTFNRRIKLNRCTSTVRTLISSTSAISRFVCPIDTRRRFSRCRGVRSSASIFSYRGWILLNVVCAPINSLFSSTPASLAKVWLAVNETADWGHFRIKPIPIFPRVRSTGVSIDKQRPGTFRDRASCASESRRGFPGRGKGLGLGGPVLLPYTRSVFLKLIVNILSNE